MENKITVSDNYSNESIGTVYKELNGNKLIPNYSDFSINSNTEIIYIICNDAKFIKEFLNIGSDIRYYILLSKDIVNSELLDDLNNPNIVKLFTSFSLPNIVLTNHEMHLISHNITLSDVKLSNIIGFVKYLTIKALEENKINVEYDNVPDLDDSINYLRNIDTSDLCILSDSDNSRCTITSYLKEVNDDSEHYVVDSEFFDYKSFITNDKKLILVFKTKNDEFYYNTNKEIEIKKHLILERTKAKVNDLKSGTYYNLKSEQISYIESKEFSFSTKVNVLDTKVKGFRDKYSSQLHNKSKSLYKKGNEFAENVISSLQFTFETTEDFNKSGFKLIDIKDNEQMEKLELNPKLFNKNNEYYINSKSSIVIIASNHLEDFSKLEPYKVYLK